MAIPILSRFTGAWRDLRDFLASRQRHQFVFAALSVAICALLVAGFYHDSKFPWQDRIVYVQSWPANRTDAEIIAQQKVDRIAKQKAQAERQAAYRRLAKMSGIE
jgi:hypothetical protein